MKFMHIFLIITLLLTSSFVYAQKNSSNLYFVAAGEYWQNDDPSGHGILLLHYLQKYDNNKKTFQLVYNTDTLQFSFDNRLSTQWAWGVWLKGEYAFSGLLPDYYKKGELVKEGSLNASFIELENHIVYYAAKHSVKLSAFVKQWFFDKNDTTGQEFTLPNDFFSLTPEFIYTYWSVNHDKSIDDPHRLFKRVNGLMVQLRSGSTIRNKTNRWGFITTQNNRINNAKKISYHIKETISFGVKLLNVINLRILQNFYWSEYSDDIFHERLGGISPYVDQIGGLPWAAFLSSKHITIHPAIVASLFKKHELGLYFDIAYLEDVERTGSRSWDLINGLSVYADLRIKDWQFDIKGGFSLPNKNLEKDLYYSIYFALGKKLF